jgi:Fic family protein
MITEQETLFLSESNKIEQVYDQDSLNQAIEAWEYIKTKNKLTTDVILKTHKILMKNQPLADHEKGQFRRVAVYIGHREGKPWYAVPELTVQWCEIANQTVNEKFKYRRKDLEELIRQDHVSFENIHPFIDGNGRTGRILLNWQRIKSGLPILVLFEDKKYNYYRWFGD